MAQKRIYELAENTAPDTAYNFAIDKSGGASAERVTLATLLGLARVGKNVLYVDPKGGTSTYTTLSAALAAITTASDSNEYLIVVTGEVAETAAVAAKSHVHVLFLPGASVTVTSTSNVHAINMASLSNAIWAAVDGGRPHIIRAGAVSGAVYGIYATSCAATVCLCGLIVSNLATGGSACHGIYSNGGQPTMIACTGSAGVGGYGIANANVSGMTMTDCAGNGGSSGTACHGIYNGASSLSMTRCTGIGGGGGAGSHGIYNYICLDVEMTGCTGVGGAGGDSCVGLYNYVSRSKKMVDCIGIGGGGGATCYGILVANGGAATMIGCTGIGGGGGASSYGIFFAVSSFCLASRCVGIGGGARGENATKTISASTRQEDSFQPSAAFAYRIVAATINVTAAAAAGITLTLRDAAAGAGNALTSAVAVDSLGYKYFPITGARVITAGNLVYARLSGSDSTLAYTITYTYEINYSTCYGLYHDSNSSCAIMDCSFFSNASSAAIYVTNNGDDRSVFDGGTARSGLNDAGRSKGFTCQSAWNPASVYNMVLAGGSTNLTCGAGTANGTCVEV